MTSTPTLFLALSFFIATAMSLVLVPLVTKIAATQGLFDAHAQSMTKESHRKIHATPIPRLGGIAIVIAFLCAISIFPTNVSYQGVLVGSLFVFLCGVIDDFVPLSAKLRLFVQAITAGAVVHFEKLSVEHLVFTKQLIFSIPEPLGFLLAIFLILGAVNSINLIDGLDGLAAGVVLIGVALLAFADFVTTQNISALLVFGLPMMGAIFGFLRYNTHPASIFMGDGGSNWLGFMSGCLILITMKNSAAAGTSIPFISVILTFAIPIIDTAAVMARRIKNKRSPFSADKNHFHHTLIRIGLSHSQSVMSIYFLAFACGVLGIFPAIFPKYDFPWVPYLVFMIQMILIPVSANLDDNSIKAATAAESTLRAKPYSSRITAMIYFWENLNRYLLFAILILGPALSGQVPRELGPWSIGVMFLLLVSAFIPHTRRGAVFFDSFAISAASVVILVVNNMNPMTIQWEGAPLQIHGGYNALFTILFFSSVLLFLVTARRRSIIFSPPDFLLLTVPLLILLLPKTWQLQYKLDLISLRCLVIFMAIRVLSKRKPRYISSLKIACGAALAWVYLVAMHGVRVLY